VELRATPGVIRGEVKAGTAMSDDKNQWGFPYRKRIESHPSNEVPHPSKSLEITPEQLQEVAARVGTSAQKVRESLWKL
jgi:hypothetical protein